MPSERPKTIAAYIREAPREGQPLLGQPLLGQLYALLKSVAPDAQETIKWGTPFFVEPRFVFAFSAHKAHASFAPAPAVLEAFRTELAKHKTTKGTLHLPYDEPLPEELIRRLAEYSVKLVRGRKDDAFW